MSVWSLKGEMSGQWKWVLRWIQALFWGYYCFWLRPDIGWLFFIPLGGLQSNLWPKLSQGTGKHKLKIVAVLFKFNTEIVRDLITTDRLQFSNLPFQRKRDCQKTPHDFNSDMNAASPERPQRWGIECPFLLFCSQRMTLATSASLIRRLCGDIEKPDLLWHRPCLLLMLISV